KRAARNGLGRRREPIRATLGACGLDEGRALISRKFEHIRQPRGHLARWAARVGLDLLNEIERAPDPLRERRLSQIQRFAPPLDPQAERNDIAHEWLPSQRMYSNMDDRVVLCVRFSVQLIVLRNSTAA